jgi:hypothetical protein
MLHNLQLVLKWLGTLIQRRTLHYTVQGDDVILVSGKSARKVFAISELDWWRYDERMQVSVVSLHSGRKLFIKDPPKKLPEILEPIRRGCFGKQ